MQQQRPYTIKDREFWKISVVLALGSFFIFACLYAVQPLLPVFVNVFHVSVSESSLSLSLTIVGLIIGLNVLGLLSDRYGRTFFIKGALVGSFLLFLMIPLTGSFLLLLVLRFIQGFVLAGLPAASLAYLSEEIDKRSLSIAIPLYISSNAFGGMMGRVFTGYFTDLYSWEQSFYLLGIVGAVITLIVFLKLPKSRYFMPSNVTFTRDIEGFLFHLKNPSLLLVFGLGIVLQFSFTGVWTYLPFYLQEPPFSLSLRFISYLFFAYGFGIAGSLLAGWLARFLGLKRMRIVGVFILSLGVLLTLSMSLPVIIIGLCVTCFGFFTAHSLTATSVSHEATHYKGSASSLYLVAYYIGVAGGSSVLGPIWDQFGWIGLVLLTGLLPIIYISFVRLISSRRHKRFMT